MTAPSFVMLMSMESCSKIFMVTPVCLNLPVFDCIAVIGNKSFCLHVAIILRTRYAELILITRLKKGGGGGIFPDCLGQFSLQYEF